jgi:excisionase family DNA binding protein
MASDQRPLNRRADSGDRHHEGQLDRGPSVLDELMTSSDVAELLHTRLSTIQGYARSGLLPSVKVGRHRRFIRSQVERAIRALIEGQATEAAPRARRSARA